MAVSRIDYLSRDYEGFRTSLRQYAQAVFPEWTPGSEGDFGLVLVELFSYMGDILSYYTDRAQFENYLPTATQRDSILNLAYILGYIPHAGSPATGSVSLTTVAGTAGAVNVPAGLRLATNRIDQIDGPVVFETTEAVLLPSNADGAAAPTAVPVVEGTTRTGVLLGTSDGSPGQVFPLPNTGVYPDTVNIYIEDPSGSIVLQPEAGGPTVNVQQWLRVARLLGEAGAGRVFEARPSATTTNVLFGDDMSGDIPATGLRIFATYRYGVGSWGNLPAGAVRNVDAAGVSDLSAVRVAATGVDTYLSTVMTGGVDEETNRSIRDNAPLAFRAQERVVTLADYVSVALGTPGVRTAAAVAGYFTSVTLFITGPGGAVASAALKEAVYDRLRERLMGGVSVTISDPTFQPIDFGSSGAPILISVDNGYPVTVVEDAVRRAIIYLVDEMPAEQSLAASDVYSAMIAVDGVRQAQVPVITRTSGAVQTDTSTITPQPWEVFTVGSVYLTVT